MRAQKSKKGRINMMLKRYLLLLVFGAGSLCGTGWLLGSEIQAGGGQQSDQKSNEPKKEPSPKLDTRDSTRDWPGGMGGTDSTKSGRKAATKHHKGGKKSKKSSSKSTTSPK
jgi:hypothetical protein